jgi:RNA polymerase sigma-70 factor (ECF subfamily)
MARRTESVDDQNRCAPDRESREQFVRETYAELYRWFCRLARCSNLAADLTQETFAAFWTSAANAPATVSSRTWLYAIGRNVWRNQFRDRRRAEDVAIALLPASNPAPESSALDHEFQEAVDIATASLPDDLREAFTLRFWQQLDYEEIGLIQGVSAGLARWRYFAARRRLHEKLALWDPNPKRAREDRHAR